MKTILILGAGLSASSLIRYLLEHATTNGWLLRVTDQDIELVKRKIHGHPNATALNFNALDPAERRPEIERADLVISMLPARFHPEVAKDCVDYKKNLITPSYISPEMRSLDEKARQAHITIMNEIGVDPGIDHMSAMKIIHQIKDSGGKMTAFRSFCGGLMAPESDNNPWNYKFTWNPRNVVLAGQGGASCFLDHGEYKYIPYNRLFSRLMRISIDGYGDFEGYANRDSLSYRKTYGLENIPTIYRGNAFLPYHPNMSVEDKFRQFLGKEREGLFERFEWLGLFSKEVTIGVVNASPAQLLEKILTGKLVLNAGDKDMLVMYHEFEYEKDGQRYLVTSSMVNVGEDQIYTSMSNTVGLPVAIAAKMILNGQIRKHGVTLPIEKEIYTPILKELEDYGILFSETKTEF